MALKMMKLPFLGIRTKLLIAFGGLSLAPLITFGIYTIQYTSKVLKASTANATQMRLKTTAKHIGEEITLLIVHSQALADQLSDEAKKNEALNEIQLKRIFTRSLHRSPKVLQLRLLDTSGNEVIRIERNGESIVDVEKERLQDKSKRPYYRENIQRPLGSISVSWIDLNIEQGRIELPHQLVFRITNTIDLRGKVHLIVMNVDAAEVLPWAAMSTYGKSIETFVVNTTGQLVFPVCTPKHCSYQFRAIRAVYPSMSDQTRTSLIRGESNIFISAGDRFVSYAPIVMPKPYDGIAHIRLLISHSKAVVLGPTQKIQSLALLFGSLVALVAVALAALAAQTLTNPIQELLQFVRGIATGEFHRSLEVNSKDEFEQLATSAQDTARALETTQNELTSWNRDLQAQVEEGLQRVDDLRKHKRDLEAQVQHADRLASLGMLTASLAHEIGNPLAGMKTLIQVRMKKEDVTPESREVFDVILHELDRLSGILTRTTSFAAPLAERNIEITLKEVHGRTVLLVARESMRKRIRHNIAGDAISFPLRAAPHRFEQILVNLIINAIQAMEEPGIISTTADFDKDHIVLTVLDSGPGVPFRLRERVFEPFVTSKASGTGLGLSIVRQIVSEMKGTIDMSFPNNGGTQVQLRFPIPSEKESFL